MAIRKFGMKMKIEAKGTKVADVLTEDAVKNEVVQDEVAKNEVVSKTIETKRDDFIYFRSRAISAGDQGPKPNVPNYNGNGDYFPRKELESSFLFSYLVSFFLVILTLLSLTSVCL